MTLTSYRIDRPDADRLLVLLHGWSAEQHHLAAYVPLIDPDERFTAVCPRAIHDLDDGDGDGASWYERDEGGPVDTSYTDAIDRLHEFVAGEMERTGIGPDRTVIGGFSQGGFLSLSLALLADAPRYAGVWAMCCGLHQVDGLQLDVSAGSGGDRPALLQFGELDTIIPPERTVAAADAVRTAGWTVETHGYPMAHSQRIEMMIDAKRWLGAVD